MPLPAPTGGLRVTALGEQRAVAALPAGDRQASAPGIRLDQVAPERIVVLPRDANRPFYDAVVAASRHAGLSPTLIDMPDGHVERALLAVASGAELRSPRSPDEERSSEELDAAMRSDTVIDEQLLYEAIDQYVAWP